MIRILSAEAHAVTFRLREGYRIAGMKFSTAKNVILKIGTSDGRTGFGCAAPFEEVTGESPATSLALLRDQLIPLLRESDAADPEGIASRAAVIAPRAPAVRAALDMALHDLAGRRAGAPLYRLLGASRDRLPTSVTLGISDTLEAAVDLARRHVSGGFRILKLKVGEDWEADARLVGVLRRTLGPAIVLRADGNQGYSETDAARFLQAVAPHRLELLEQPTSASDEAALGRLSRLALAPIMADESLHSEEDAARLIAGRAVGLFNIKLMKAGGVGAALAIARKAAAGGLGVMFGCNDESRISIAAALHTALAAPGDVRADLDGHLDLQDDVARGGVCIRDGFIEPVGEAGLGVVADV